MFRKLFKALLHDAMFSATCFAMALQNRSHEPLQRVTCHATLEFLAMQVAAIVAQSRIGFYFLQRLQQLVWPLHRVTPLLQLVSQ